MLELSCLQALTLVCVMLVKPLHPSVEALIMCAATIVAQHT